MADPDKPSSPQRAPIMITNLTLHGLPPIDRKELKKTYMNVNQGGVPIKTGYFRAPSLSSHWTTDTHIVIDDLNSVTSIKFSMYKHRSLHADSLLGSVEIPVASFLPSLEELAVQFSVNNSATWSTLTVRYETNMAKAASELLASSVTPREGFDPAALSSARDNIQDVVEIASSFDFLESIKPFKEMFDRIAQVHPVASAAWTFLTIGINVMETQHEKDKEIVELQTTMVQTFEIANQQDVIGELNVLRSTFETMIKQTIECHLFISEYASKGYLRRLVGIDIPRKTAEFRQVFEDLQGEFRNKLDRHVAVVTIATREVLENIEQDITLNKLKRGNQLRPRDRCLVGTRVESISYIISWIAKMDGEVMFLTGLPGTGKSTLMSSILDASLYMGAHSRLGAYIRFDTKAMNDASSVIASIAHSLALFDKRIAEKVSIAVKENLSRFELMTMQDCFTKLLLEPLKAVKELREEGPIIILVDALDECAASKGRTELSKILAGGFGATLPFMRLVVASRALPEITTVFNSRKMSHIHTYSLDSVGTATERDIKLYFTERFGELGNDAFDKMCDERNAIQVLTKRACGLFIWAFTTYTYIKQSPLSRLLGILETTGPAAPEAALDAIYHVALGADLAGPGSNDDIKADMRTILGAILVVENPPGLVPSAIDDLLFQGSLAKSQDILPKLGCVVVAEGSQGPLRTIHTSFGDFLLDKRRSGEDWHVDVGQHNKDIVRFCLRTLGMHFGQKISNSAILMPSAAIDAIIPCDAHAYACQFWIVHLCKLDPKDHDLDGYLKTFLEQHFLMWLYSMGKMGKSDGILPLMRRFLQHTNEAGASYSAAERQLRHDALQFAEQFIMDVQEDPSSIFSTALLFCPVDNTLRTFYPRPASSATVEDMQYNRLLSVSVHPALVWSACFFPDGTKYVTACDNFTVRIWDAQTGAPLSDPMNGHEGTVVQVSVSPDGLKVASAGPDDLVIVWDAITGNQLLKPLRGHTDSVNAVDFNADSSKVVSAGEDKSIRVWDTQTGLLILGPILGHTRAIMSVVFSPDGQKILSGADDGTIHVWDASNGVSLETIHVGSMVKSVAFSPDGSKIVSGSADNQIRIWHTLEGSLVLQPICGHMNTVQSVSFSKDGSQIVSCGDDDTIRVWDSTWGHLLLTAHASGVGSVQFSPDNTQILFASNDRTARILGISEMQDVPTLSQRLWNGATASLLVNSPEYGSALEEIAFSSAGDVFAVARGKTIEVRDSATYSLVSDPIFTSLSYVMTIAYSPVADLIASGLDDGTIQLWDAKTGNLHGKTFHGHGDVVRRVSFSSNGSRLVSASNDHTIMVWDVITGKSLFKTSRSESGEVSAASFSPDDATIASGSNDCTVRVWDALTGESLHAPLLAHTQPVRDVAWSPHGNMIASASQDGTVKLWGFPRCEVVREFRVHGSYSQYLHFWPDGLHLLIPMIHGMIYTWNVLNGQPLFEPIHAHTARITSAVLSPDASRILTTSYDNTLRVWDTKSCALLATPIDPYTLVTSFCHSADVMVLAAIDCSIHVWSTSTITRLYEPLVGHKGRVLSLSMDRSGLKLVSASEDRSFIVWDLVEGVSLYRKEAAHSDVLTSVRFSPDGLKLATGSADTTIKLWATLDGASIPEPILKGQSARVQSVGFSPDGCHIASASLDNTMRVWDASTGELEFVTDTVGGPLAEVVFSVDGQSLIYTSKDGMIYTCPFRPTALAGSTSDAESGENAEDMSQSDSQVLVKFPRALRNEITAMYMTSSQLSVAIRPASQLITVKFP